MSIIVRDAGAGFQGIPEDWDRNRIDIELAPPAIKDLGKAVCSFVPLGIRNRTLAAAHCATLEVEACDLIQKEIDSRKAICMHTLNQYRDITVQDVAYSEANLEAARRARNAADVTRYTAELAANKNHHTVAVDLYNQRKVALDALPWPHSTPGKLRTRFSQQAVCSTGTGFSLSPGYVMTAGHIMEDVKQWAKFKVIYNLRARRAAAKRVGYLSGGDFDTELWTRDFEPHQPGHEINRVVLKEFFDMRLVNFDVHTCDDNDAAIVELCVDTRSPFPAEILGLATAPPPLGTPVYAVGHPQALPLKYLSYTPNAPNQPHITGPTGVNAWGIAPTCMTADLDKFGGMSGGPLFAVGSTDVIGIGRSGAKTSSRPIPPDTLQTDEYNWRTESAKQLFVILSAKEGHPIAPPATPMLPAAFFYNFGNYQYHRKIDHFTVLQNLPTDPAITLQNAWNRVDTYRAFTRPLADFLATHNRRICVVVTIDVRCTFDLALPISIPVDMEFDHNPQSTPFCEHVYAQRGSADSDYGNYHFEWQRDFGAIADLDENEAPWSDVTGLPRGAMQGPAFRSPKGLMGWSKIHIPFAPELYKKADDRVVDISGTIEVTFGYEHAVPENALQFKVNLEFPLPSDNKRWVGLIGEYPVRHANGQEISFRSEGYAWTGPWAGASLPIVQRPTLPTLVAQSLAEIQTSANLAVNQSGP